MTRAGLGVLLAVSGPVPVQGRTVIGNHRGSTYTCTIRDSDNALVSCEGEGGDLFLGNNAISTLQAGVFDGLSALAFLDLYDNTLSTLQVGVFDGLPALTRLYLDHNAMTTLQAGVFNGLSALKTLTVHFNAVSTLQAGVFNGLPALTRLWLQDNPFTSFPCDWGVNTAVTTDLQFPAGVSTADCVRPTPPPPTTPSPTASPTTSSPMRSPPIRSQTRSPTASLHRAGAHHHDLYIGVIGAAVMVLSGLACLGVRRHRSTKRSGGGLVVAATYCDDDVALLPVCVYSDQSVSPLSLPQSEFCGTCSQQHADPVAFCLGCGAACSGVNDK